MPLKGKRCFRQQVFKPQQSPISKHKTKTTTKTTTKTNKKQTNKLYNKFYSKNLKGAKKSLRKVWSQEDT